MRQNTGDIFEKYYQSEVELIDRYLQEPEQAVDVIIPVINTNPLWKVNLFNFYAQIPIARLLIGDAGCTDNTVEIVRNFPRVEIIDQRRWVSQGICIAELIGLVETDWFIYLHADVYLPDGWFDTMLSNQSRFDWFECNRRKTVLLDYADVWQNAAPRSYSGSQMGRKAAFTSILDQIEDDYLQRNEDLIFRQLVEKAGGRYGRVAETFHYHQIMNRFGEMEPDFIRVELTKERDAAWEKKIWNMQARGLIKYTQPDQPHLIRNVHTSMRKMYEYGILNFKEFSAWTAQTNPNWLPYVKGLRGRLVLIRPELQNVAHSLFKIGKIVLSFFGINAR